MKIACTSSERKLTIWEVVMPRYLSVESELVSVSCYTCGTGFAFVDYNKMVESTCTECATPLFLPHELEGIVKK